jgi:hypothetical protein
MMSRFLGILVLGMAGWMTAGATPAQAWHGHWHWHGNWGGGYGSYYYPAYRFNYGYYYPGRVNYSWTRYYYSPYYGTSLYWSPYTTNWYYWHARSRNYYPVNYINVEPPVRGAMPRGASTTPVPFEAKYLPPESQ